MKDPASMLARARNVFFSQWEETLRLRLVVLKSCEQEDIHDLRVASRRLRAALNLLGPMCDPMDVRKVSRAVRRLTRTLGTLRNLDEAMTFFGSHAEEAAMAGLMRRLADMRKNERHEVIMELKDFKHGRLDPLVRAMVADMTPDNMQKRGLPPLPSYLSDTAITLFEAVHSHIQSALPLDGIEERHALRIAIKKWRYFLELVARIVERDYDAVLERLKRYQSILGSMNDMSVFAQMCRESGKEGDDPDAALQLIRLETDRLYAAFVSLVETEPLGYTFLI